MEPYQERVIAEAAELTDKFNKLTKFTLAGVFETLPVAAQFRIRLKVNVMRMYLITLQERIDEFKDQDNDST